MRLAFAALKQNDRTFSSKGHNNAAEVFSWRFPCWRDTKPKGNGSCGAQRCEFQQSHPIHEDSALGSAAQCSQYVCKTFRVPAQAGLVQVPRPRLLSFMRGTQNPRGVSRDVSRERSATHDRTRTVRCERVKRHVVACLLRYTLSLTHATTPAGSTATTGLHTALTEWSHASHIPRKPLGLEANSLRIRARATSPGLARSHRRPTL